MPSKTSKAIMAAMRTVHQVFDGFTLEEQRQAQDNLDILVPQHKNTICEYVDAIGVPCAWLRKEKNRSEKRIIIYLHGGAFVTGTLKYSKIIASRLCFKTGYDTLAVEYRLAPENPYPAALEDVLKVWEYCLAQGFKPENIQVAGESAGGNLAMSFMLRLIQQKSRVPEAVLLMSPWADVSCSGDSYIALQCKDPSLTLECIQENGKMYAKDNYTKDPLISPVFADFTGFPRTLIQVGTNELLLSDALATAREMMDANVDCQFELWDGMCHVFQIYPFKESKKAWNRIAQFLTRN